MNEQMKAPLPLRVDVDAIAAIDRRSTLRAITALAVGCSSRR